MLKCQRKEGKQGGFCQELGDQQSPAGSDHLAQADLFGPFGRPGRGQADVVQRGNQEEEESHKLKMMTYWILPVGCGSIPLSERR